MPSNTPDSRIRRRRRLGVAALLGYPLLAGGIAFVHFGWAWAVTAALPGYLPFMVLGYLKLRQRPRLSKISRKALPGYFAAFTVYMASVLFPLVAMYSRRGMPGWLAVGIAGTAALALIGLIWPTQLRYYRTAGLLPLATWPRSTAVRPPGYSSPPACLSRSSPSSGPIRAS